jgi:phosphatidylglycerophosphatase A
MARVRLKAASLKDPVVLVACGFGAGLAPYGPGTAGTLLAVPVAWLIASWPFAWRLGAVAAVCVVGTWICGEAARRLGRHDPPAIVLDEVAGYLAVCLAAPPGVIWLFAAFVLFRIFDILKPWPIRDLDHSLGGGIGIMLDDLMAAAYSAASLLAYQYIFP